MFSNELLDSKIFQFSPINTKIEQTIRNMWRRDYRAFATTIMKCSSYILNYQVSNKFNGKKSFCGKSLRKIIRIKAYPAKFEPTLNLPEINLQSQNHYLQGSPAMHIPRQLGQPNCRCCVLSLIAVTSPKVESNFRKLYRERSC